MQQSYQKSYEKKTPGRYFVMNIEEKLAGRKKLPEIERIASWAEESSENLEELLSAAESTDRRVGVNALWAMTHLTDCSRLQNNRQALVGMLLRERDTARKRMLLQLLREQDFSQENFSGELLDYCLDKTVDEGEGYGVRCFSLYVAFKLCKVYPDLIGELEEYLELLEGQELTAGLRTALRKTRNEMAKLKKEVKTESRKR